MHYDLRHTAVFLAAVGPVLLFGGARASARVRPRPNILLVVTDDQRKGMLDSMPVTRSLGRRGRIFSRAFVATPLCCPSRATIMTGLYPHNHGVHNNGHGRRLDQESTVQRYLQDAGYATALVGKFLNSFPIGTNPSRFDKWAMMKPSAYYDTKFNINGDVRTVSAYSTDFISDKAVDFLRSFNADRDRDPWFLLVTPNAPHLPATPARRHAGAPVPEWSDNPANTERNRGDKPPWVRSQSLSDDWIKDVRRRQFRTLRSVDEMIGRLSRLLRRLHERRRTLIIFTSDNGYLWREHGLDKKRHPYEESVRVPLIARWPGHINPGRAQSRFVSLVDIAPTILDAARIRDVSTDGRSLLGRHHGRRVFMEYWRDIHYTNIPGWRAVRNRRLLYVEYLRDDRRKVIFREYYRLRHDRWQLTNVLHDREPDNNPSRQQLRRLHRRLVRLSSCDAAECS